jgi:YD repeat-containing protein
MRRAIRVVIVLAIATPASSAGADRRCTARQRIDGGTLVRTLQFDRKGRIVKVATTVKDGDGTRSGVDEWSYDAAGRVASYRESRGIEHRWIWNSDGKLDAIRIGDTDEWQEIRFAWDDGVTPVAPPKHAPVRFAWIDPARGRIYPLLFGGASGTSTTRVFDCTKKTCREKTDKRGTAAYDDRGRLIRTTRDGTEIEIRHGDDGPIEMRDPDVTTWTYERGRPVEVTTKRSNRRITWGKTGPVQLVDSSTIEVPERMPDGTYRPRSVTEAEPPLRFERCRF